MHDLDITHDGGDAIDALAREHGSALRRPAPADALARIHRGRRNRVAARASAGGVAALALVVGGVALLQRGADEQLAPATVPSTVATSAAPIPTVPASTVPEPTAPPSTAPDTRVTTLAPPVTEVTPFVAAPELLYVGADDRRVDQVQRVLDLATLEELRVEPLDDARRREYIGIDEPRTTGTTGIGYSLGLYLRDDVSDDGFVSTDRCGQRPVVVDGAPAGDLALPEVASLLAVSDDGRYVVTVSAAGACPADGLTEPGTDVEPVTFEQQVQVFDAAEPAAPGRVLFTAPSPERQFTGARFSTDGEWVALTHVVSFVDADGVLTAQRGLDVVELRTGRFTELADPGCRIIEYGQGGRLFVDGGYVLTTACEDGVYVEVLRLADLTWSRWLLPGVAGDANVTAEVWPGSAASAEPVFVATVTVPVTDGVAGRTFLGMDGEVRELPVTDARVSFGPLAELTGD